jgi:HepT-like protein
MNAKLAHVANRIRSELAELEEVVRRVEEGWKRADRSGDDYYLDGVALNLHGLYSGLERIFEVIALNVDGRKPEGENWHQELLRQMSTEILEMRPAVISESSDGALNEYRGFRHVVRNIYTYTFNRVKMRKLVEEAPGLFNQVRAELLAFADFLEETG